MVAAASDGGPAISRVPLPHVPPRGRAAAATAVPAPRAPRAEREIAVTDQLQSVEALARTVARRLAPACRSLNDSEFRDVVARVVSLVVAFRDDFRDDRSATTPAAPVPGDLRGDAP